MTHLHSHSDVLPASTFEQPKLSLPQGHQIVRRPVKALLGVVLIGSAVGLGVLIAGRSAAPGIDQNAQVNPATAPSSSVAAGTYQPGALAGYAPVEEWRAAEAGAFGEIYQYQPGAFAGYAPPEVWSQAERGTDLTTPASATTAQHPETLSAEEGRQIGLAAVDDIQRRALQAAGCGPEDLDCKPTTDHAATHSALSYADDIQWRALQAVGCGPEAPDCKPIAPADQDGAGLGDTGDALGQHAETLSAEEARQIGLAAVDDIQRQALQAAGCAPEEAECPPTASAGQDGAGLGDTGDALGQHTNGFLNRDGEPEGWVPQKPSAPFGPI